MSRARKPHSATGEYTPVKHKPFAKAFTMFGHGKESDEIIRVPDNCMVITLGISGDYISASNFFPRIKRMIDMPLEVLLNPLAYPKEIFEAFGPLTYYLPGTECPNFKYTLGSMVRKADGTVGTLFPGSGIANIADMQKKISTVKLKEQIGLIQNTPSIDTVKISIAKTYGISTFPGPRHILKLLDDPSIDISYRLANETYKPITESIDEIIAKVSHTMSPEKMKEYVYQHGLSIVANAASIQTRQEEIFTEIFPNISAVYYNFLCRDKNLKTTALYNNAKGSIKLFRPTGLTHIPSRYQVILDKYGYVLNKNHVPLLGKFRELHMKRLNNTMNRRRQARNYYTSNFYKQKRLAPYSSVQRNYNETMQRHGYNVLRSANRAYINRLEKQLDERNQFIKDFELGVERTAPSKHSSKRSGKHSSKRDVKHSTRRHSAH
jgi:hypothetical protein